ncbi:MAG: WG repeat-containing protein, partial [Planctomycetes bacterium]|nr:WG repeat-containing protein [Planctomycetota bacterium]
MSLLTDTSGSTDVNEPVEIPAEFDLVEPFKEGRARVKMKNGDYNHLWGFIDQKGQLITEIAFKKAESFSEGLAAVQN